MGIDSDLDYFQEEFLNGSLEAFFDSYSELLSRMPVDKKVASLECRHVPSGLVIKLTGNLLIEGYAQISVNLPKEIGYLSVKPFSFSQAFFRLCEN